jgi:two-component sensor histidine kinase
MSKGPRNFKGYDFFEPLLIGFFWIILFSSPVLYGKIGNGLNWTHITKVWLDDLILLTIFLLNRFVLLPFLFFRNRRVVYIISATILVFTVVFGRYVIYVRNSPDMKNLVATESQKRPPRPVQGDIPQENRPRDNRRPPSRNDPEPLPPYVNLLVLSVLILGFDTGLKATSRLSKSEQMRMQIEKENVENQLAFLRNQVSPHFFMNTLNNIHALIDYDAGEAKNSIIKLSNLMRHLLYDSDAEFSPIISEIEFIKSYVDLMKLRYSQKVKITLDLPLSLPDKSIPPLIFTSLLENAFKHGVSYSQESFIHIELYLLADMLTFRIENSKIPPENDVMTPGIGIENTRKRLDLLFGDKYSLEITDSGNIFITNLKIPV